MSSKETNEIVSTTPSVTQENPLAPIPVPPQKKTLGKAIRWGAPAAVLAGLLLVSTWWLLTGAGRAPQVPVEHLVSGPVERVLAVSGRTETAIQSEIRSSVSARVSEVKVSEGDNVVLGEELVLLDASQQSARIKQALAALDAAVLLQQRAQADLDRLISLGGTVTAVAVANAESDLALATVEAKRMQAALEQAQLALPDYKIASPITGVVLNRSVEAGDLVGPADVLLHVADTSDLHVEVQVDELYAAKIQSGQTAWLQLTGRAGIEQGVVSFVASEVNELTGTLRVKLDFDAASDVQIGLNTVANILIESVQDAVTVPRSAFVADGTGTAVFVLRDGHAILTPITFVDWPSNRVEVTSGLVEGDILVLAPDGVEDGQPLAALDGVSTGE